MNPDDDLTPVAPDAGPLTLTTEDLKQIRNNVINALTHSPDVQAFLTAQIAAALTEAGVLTEANIHASAGLYARFQESTYEQVWKVLREAGLAKQAGPHRPS